MFEAFDFGALDDPGFKEDAVREEIVAPILKRLGYTPTGQVRVQRSQNLVHPFVKIGTRKHPVNIIPDYTLGTRTRPCLRWTPKGPPSRSWSPCTPSRRTATRSTRRSVPPTTPCATAGGWSSLMWRGSSRSSTWSAADYDRRWADIERVLRPQSLLNPAIRDFHADFGLALQRMGLKSGEAVELRSFHLLMVSKVKDGVYSAATNTLYEGEKYLCQPRLSEDALVPLLSCLAKPLLDGVLEAVERQPFHVFLDQMVEVDLVVRLGPLTKGADDSFVPLEVLGIRSTRFDRTERPQSEPVPNYIHSLRRAFESLHRA